MGTEIVQVDADRKWRIHLVVESEEYVQRTAEGRAAIRHREVTLPLCWNGTDFIRGWSQALSFDSEDEAFDRASRDKRAIDQWTIRNKRIWEAESELMQRV